MTPFQALITGAVSGALSRAQAEGPFLIDVRIGDDGQGNYTNKIYITGLESGERLVITVDTEEADDGQGLSEPEQT